MVIVVIICLIVAFILLNKWYKRTNHYKNAFIDIEKFRDNKISDDLKIVVVGSNQPKYGLDFRNSDIKGDNWTIGPEAFEYDLKVLKKHISHLSKGAVVILTVCPLSFFLYRFDNSETYQKYYQILDKKEIHNYSICGYLKSVFPILFNPTLLRYLIKDSKINESMIIDYNPLGENELKADAEKWINGWNKQFGLKLPSTEIQSQHRKDILKNIQILKEMIDFCLSKDLKPVIAILPVTKSLYTQFTQEFIDQHILAYIADANEAKVPFVNYLADNRFNDSSLYINSFFFNTKGRKIFTKQFVEDLRAQSIL